MMMKQNGEVLSKGGVYMYCYELSDNEHGEILNISIVDSYDPEKFEDNENLFLDRAPNPDRVTSELCINKISIDKIYKEYYEKSNSYYYSTLLILKKDRIPYECIMEMRQKQRLWRKNYIPLMPSKKKPVENDEIKYVKLKLDIEIELDTDDDQNYLSKVERLAERIKTDLEKYFTFNELDLDDGTCVCLSFQLDHSFLEYRNVLEITGEIILNSKLRSYVSEDDLKQDVEYRLKGFPTSKILNFNLAKSMFKHISPSLKKVNRRNENESGIITAIQKSYNNYSTKTTNKKGVVNMNMSKIFGQDFKMGKYESTCIMGSLNGLAVRNSNGNYLAWNGKELIDVTDFTFNNSMTYTFPVMKVEVGDLILKDSDPVFVEEVYENGRIKIINPNTSISEEYIPSKTMFYKSAIFVKIFSMIDKLLPKDGFSSDSQGIMQMMMMTQMMNNDNSTSKGNNIMEMMMMTQMMNNDNSLFGNSEDPMSSMLPFMMMGNNGNSDMSTMLMMQMMMKKDKPSSTKKNKAKEKEDNNGK